MLEVKNLSVEFRTMQGSFLAVNDVSFSVKSGKVLGIVGESGSGKSVSALSILRLISEPGKIVSGQILLDGRNLLSVSEEEMRQVRGKKISMIFQEPMSSLNPVFTVGDQIQSTIELHQPALSRQGARKLALQALEEVQIPDPELRFNQYPHQLSGGQRQRVALALALSCDPQILIADEPTTALDVTIQAQILELLRELIRKKNISLILITHDLRIVADLADDAAVMHRGKIVEQNSVRNLFTQPQSLYTKSLLSSFQSKTLISRNKDLNTPLLKVENISKNFETSAGILKAVRNVSFEIRKTETLGLIGESGSGKSTLARCLTKLIEPDTGKIFFENKDITYISGDELRNLRRKIQIIFQDPLSSLNPKLTVQTLLEEPLIIHNLRTTKKDRQDRALELLELVGLNKNSLNKYPHEFSGGQRQRIGIARALAVEPELLICDEPLSALDAPIQAHILNLLEELRDRLNLTYLFIAHDLRIIQNFCNRVAVMKSGEIVEINDVAKIYSDPQHPYTKTLLTSGFPH